MSGNVQDDVRLLGGSTLRSYFSPFVDQRTPGYVIIFYGDIVLNNAVFRLTILKKLLTILSA